METHIGSISIGRQFNPYNTMWSVENIQFGLEHHLKMELLLETACSILIIIGGNIKVLRDGEDAIHAHVRRETIYIPTLILDAR